MDLYLHLYDTDCFLWVLLKTTLLPTKGEKSYKFDGAATVEEDVTEAYNSFMKSSLVMKNNAGNLYTSFVSLSTGECLCCISCVHEMFIFFEYYNQKPNLV